MKTQKIFFWIGMFFSFGTFVEFTAIFDNAPLEEGTMSPLSATIIFACITLIFFFLSKNYIEELIYNFKNRKEINIAEKKLNEFNLNIKSLSLRIEYLTKEKENVEKKLNLTIDNLKKEKIDIENEISNLKPLLIEEPIIIDKYLEVFSEEIKTKLQLNQQNQKDYYNKSLSLTNIDNKTKNNVKQLLRCFDLECDVIIKSLTSKNSSVARSKINSSYNQLNNLYKYDNVSLTDDYLEMKLNELTLYYSYIVQKENESEDNRARRQLLLEEEKAEKEREIERQKVEKDLTQHNNEINKLMAYMNQSNDNIKNQLYVDKIKELEEEIKILKQKQDKINELDNMPKAGYVYIISNIGSFGENVYKIGMTRRLEPMDRIKELGDASVPFPFDVHALIFSSNAPELETILHKAFKDTQLNKLNNRKEFFKVKLDDIKELVIKNHNTTVEFIDVPEAIQYRESIK